MDAFTGRKLEAGEYRDTAVRGGLPESRNAAHAVVIGDGKHRYTSLDSLFNNSYRVRFCITINLLAAERTGVVMRIHLQRALEEVCPRRGLLHICDHIPSRSYFSPYWEESTPH